jgi:hypothetical protein
VTGDRHWLRLLALTLAQARQLSRHGDVRMTMRYTHVGLEDQAASLRSLPARPVNEESQAKVAKPASRAANDADEVQRNSIAPMPPDGHSVSTVGTDANLDHNVEPIKKPLL